MSYILWQKKTCCNFPIMRLYVARALIDQVLFPKPYSFLNHERIVKSVIKSANRLYWMHILLYAYICCILLYMFALTYVVCCQYKAFFAKNIIDLNILLNLSCTKVAVISATDALLTCHWCG